MKWISFKKFSNTVLSHIQTTKQMQMHTHTHKCTQKQTHTKTQKTICCSICKDMRIFGRVFNECLNHFEIEGGDCLCFFLGGGQINVVVYSFVSCFLICEVFILNNFDTINPLCIANFSFKIWKPSILVLIFAIETIYIVWLKGLKYPLSK